MYNKLDVDELDKSVTTLVDGIDQIHVYDSKGMSRQTNTYLSVKFPKDSIKNKILESIKHRLCIDSYDEWADKSVKALLKTADLQYATKDNLKAENSLSYTKISGNLDIHIEPFAINGPCKILILLSNNTVEVSTSGKVISYGRGDVCLLNTKLPHSQIITSGEDSYQRWLIIEGFITKADFPQAWVNLALNS